VVWTEHRSSDVVTRTALRLVDKGVNYHNRQYCQPDMSMPKYWPESLDGGCYGTRRTAPLSAEVARAA
jgi:hypothetical protein